MATTTVPFPNFTSVFFPTAAPEFGFFPAPPCNPATFGAQASDFFPAPAYVNPPAYPHLPYSQILPPPLERTTPTATQSPVSAPSEFYGAHCLQSSLPGRPKMQQHKEGRYEAEESDGASPRYDCTYSGNATHFMMPKFRCPSGDLTTSTDTSGMSIDGSKHVHKQQGPDILSMGHVGSTYDFAPAPSPVLDLNRSYGWQPEFQQGATSDSPALHVFDEMPTPGSGYENYCTGHPNPVQSFCMQDGSTTFSQYYLERMPQQYGFHNLNRQSVFLIDGTEHTYYVLPENYSFECTTSSTSPAMPTAEVSNSCQSFTPPRNDQISEEETHPGTETQSICDMLAQIQSKLQTMSENLRQDLKRMKSWETKRPAAAQPNHLTQEAINMSDEMPLYDVYDEDDNSCSTGICSVLDTSLVNQQDGESEADTYPLERAAHGPVFDAYDDETDGCSHEFVDMFATNLDQQPYEEEQQASDQLLKCVSKATELKQTSSCVHTTSDVQVFSLELQQENDERAYSCSDLKASDSVVTRSSQLSIEHSMRELRLLWDPGASAYLHSSKAEPPRELSYVAILFPKVLALCNQVGNYVEQQLTDQLWNLLAVHERRREWDPGDIVDVLHTSILAEETSTHLTECNSLEYFL